MNQRFRRWTEAVKLLVTDPTTRVKCPMCGQANLTVTDVPYTNNPERFERYIRCPACKEMAIVRMGAGHSDRSNEST